MWWPTHIFASWTFFLPIDKDFFTIWLQHLEQTMRKHDRLFLQRPAQLSAVSAPEEIKYYSKRTLPLFSVSLWFQWGSLHQAVIVKEELIWCKHDSISVCLCCFLLLDDKLSWSQMWMCLSLPVTKTLQCVIKITCHNIMMHQDWDLQFVLLSCSSVLSETPSNVSIRKKIKSFRQKQTTRSLCEFILASDLKRKKQKNSAVVFCWCLARVQSSQLREPWWRGVGGKHCRNWELRAALGKCNAKVHHFGLFLYFESPTANSQRLVKFCVVKDPFWF